MALPKRAAERIASGLKRYQTVLAGARDRDISESDTVVIIGDMLADLLGYQKYVEVTTEFAIRNSFVDLTVRVGEEIRFLVEAKAIGVELKDNHVKQAVDYGANQGVEWVLLTNGAVWRVYKVLFQQPIEKALVFECNLLTANPRAAEVIECFGNLSREGFTSSSMAAFHQQQQATGKFSVAAILLSESVLAAARRELRRMYPSVRCDVDTLRAVVEHDVLKREVVDSDDAKAAQAALKKLSRALARSKEKEGAREAEEAQPVPVQGAPPVPAKTAG